MAAKINSGRKHPKFIDLTGKRFGKLVCVDYIRHPLYIDKDQRWAWECHCDCGNVSYVRTTAFKGDKPQQSCKKCSIETMAAQRVLKDFLSLRNRIYRQYKKGAEDRGYLFTLTFEEMESLIYKNCYFCNQSPEEHKGESVYKAHEGTFKRNGIDRLDNTIGYVFSNCVPCCFTCNKMKLDYTKEMFTEKVKQIYEFFIKKK